MKYLNTIVVVVGLAFTTATSHAGITLNFANLSGSSIDFDGTGRFSFSAPLGQNDFIITGPSGSSALNYQGNIAGLFKIGAITTIGQTQGASVTTVGAPAQVTISDGALLLTGILTWNTIESTHSGNAGTTVNVNGDINVTAITYSGIDPDLIALAATGVGEDQITFTTSGGADLASLSTTITHDSYSGFIATAVPEPTSMIAGALLLLPFGLSILRVCRKNKLDTAVV